MHKSSIIDHSILASLHEPLEQRRGTRRSARSSPGATARRRRSGAPGIFDRLDHAVGRGRRDLEARRRACLHRLMVPAVDRGRSRRPRCARRAASRAASPWRPRPRARSRCGGSRTAWSSAPGDLGRDVLDQRAAQRHVQHLHAAADRQERQVGVERAARASAISNASRPGSAASNVGVRRLAVERRIDVAAAGQQQAVDARQDVRRASRRRRRPRSARRRRGGPTPRSRTSAGSGRSRSGAWCAASYIRGGTAMPIRSSARVSCCAEIRHRRGAPPPHVVALFVEDRRAMIEGVEDLRQPERVLGQHREFERTAPPARRRRRGARPRGPAPTARGRRRSPSSAPAARRQRREQRAPRRGRRRSCSFWKMLLARTTAYCRYGPLSPSKLSASSMSNAMTLVREYLTRK